MFRVSVWLCPSHHRFFFRSIPGTDLTRNTEGGAALVALVGG